MFAHIFINRIKSLVRNRSLLFWTLAFPLVLSSLFSFAFSNMLEAENFTVIPIAIVEDENLKENLPFKETMSALSTGGNPLIEVTYTTLENASILLEENEIEGFITIEDTFLLTVKKEGLNQTILKNILEDFIQTNEAITSIISHNPDILQSDFLEEATVRSSYIKEDLIDGEDANPMTSYYYAIIAMSCLFSGMFGLKCIRELQPNQTAKGVRRSMAPVHKSKVFAYEFLATLCIQFVEVFIVLSYVILVLDIDFGTKIPAMILTCMIGSLCGVSFGTFIGAIIPKGENLQGNIFQAITLLSCFLAGLMVGGIKYFIETNIPLINDINPATLISDAFYSLYYFDTYTRYLQNISSLLILSGFFLTITCLIVRRENYASV